MWVVCLFVLTYMEIERRRVNVQWGWKDEHCTIKLLRPPEKPLLAGCSCVQKLSRKRDSGDRSLPDTPDTSAELLQRT